MFTGIIQEIGQITRIESRGGKYFTASCFIILHQLKIGDSISVNGACQTATNVTNNSFSWYSSNETLLLTNLNSLKQGDYVNLERPLSLNSLLDGHLVQGHVDDTGVIQSIKRIGDDYIIKIGCSKELLNYMIKKGSIAIDGVSLTINKVYNDSFLLSIIPTTFEKTIFKYYKTSDKINIEIDIFAKYIEKFLINKGINKKLNRDFLAEHGF
ncbi:MAG: riboflavin synthase [Spirochaetota bacterium]|nr:riboflavin synthase [Spirochaetota bacterium]